LVRLNAGEDKEYAYKKIGQVEGEYETGIASSAGRG